MEYSLRPDISGRPAMTVEHRLSIPPKAAWTEEFDRWSTPASTRTTADFSGSYPERPWS